MLAVVLAATAGWIWSEPAVVTGTRIGATTAWAIATASVVWLIRARERSTEAFWWAFGGGMALRGAGLAGLAVWGLRRAYPSMEGLLLSYGFTVLALLLTLEIRHLRLK